MLRAGLRLGRSLVYQHGIAFRLTGSTQRLSNGTIPTRTFRIWANSVKPPILNESIHRSPLSPQLRRWATTVTRGSEQTSTVPPRSVGYWLLSCSALAFAIVVVGGITRLTESGLSITEWKPITGVAFPRTAEKWQEEFEKYSLSPEYKMSVNSL